MEKKIKIEINNLRKEIKKKNIKIDYFNCSFAFNQVSNYKECLSIYNKIFFDFKKYFLSNKRQSYLSDFWIIGIIFFLTKFDLEKENDDLFKMIQVRVTSYRKSLIVKKNKDIIEINKAVRIYKNVNFQ